MADEATVVRTGWETCIASAAVSDGAYSTSGNSSSLNDMGTGTISAAQKDWPLLDFYLNVSAGTIAAGDVVELYRVPNSSANTAEDFDTGRDYVDSAVLTAAGDADVYFYGIANIDQYDEWQVKVTCNAASLTLSVKLRTRGLEPAA